MKIIVIGDYGTILGTPEKPGKVAWLWENGIQVDGVQIISLAQDMLPQNLEAYPQKLADLVDKIPGLKRISAAILCWPHIKKIDEERNVAGVAVTNMLCEDFYTPALFICMALQKIHNQFGISVDISYHPMLTVPTRLIPQLDPDFHQKFLWECEMNRRKEFAALLRHYGLTDVGINIENEPMTSDPWANLTHTGNRLFSEAVYQLPDNWGITADLQHLAMALACINDESLRPVFDFNPNAFHLATSWEQQFDFLDNVRGNVTFHVAQMEDSVRHVTPPIRFDDPAMDWPLILRLMKKLDEYRDGNVWYAVEQDGGHVFPEGYEMDLVAFRYLQEYFGRT